MRALSLKGQENMKLRLSGIVSNSVVDGTGMRMTIFTQGCPHNCKGCHNPQTHDFEGGYLEEISEIVDKFKKDPLLKGITLSGGEPFCQAEPLIELCGIIKALKKDIWAFSGYRYEQLLNEVTPCSKELLKQVDVLVDDKFELDKMDLTLYFRGSSNQRIIDVQKSLKDGEISIINFEED